MDTKIKPQEPMVIIPQGMDCRSKPKDDEKLIGIVFDKKRAKKVLHQWLNPEGISDAD